MLPERVLARLEELAAHATELEQRLQTTEVASDHLEFARLNRELTALRSTVDLFADYRQAEAEVDEAKEILAGGGSDADIRELATLQLEESGQRLHELSEEVKRSLVSEDPDDIRDAIIEIRAGTGGDEAALFAGDLTRMYELLAKRRGWKVEVIDSHGAEQGGFKEVSFAMRGKGVFGNMRFESGVHRVQRVPKTETQGRIHTSTASVAVLPEAEEVEVHVDERDVEMDAMRAGGPGGQNVNKTSSAVRLTHVPTGIVVKCQADPSQHKNRATAMRLLKAKLYEIEREKKARERSETRASQIGTGDRSEKIRTYNYKESRVTDHRIKMTIHNLTEVLDGHLDELMDGLKQDEISARLEAL
ncbi:MAG: peptide chain release factor 1 [Planctomycetota bacterium]|nr:peptide chain release factor 1 [Planctomycetota bacterium]